jgi:hypothetical protein
MAAAPSPHLWAFFSPNQPPPPFHDAPDDAGTKDRIFLLAKYAMQNGTDFIEMVRTKQTGNPEYAFLTPGGTDNGFYMWALYATGCGLPVDQPAPQGWSAPAALQHHNPAVPYMQQQQQVPYGATQYAAAQQQQPYHMQQYHMQYQQYPGMMQQQQQPQQLVKPTPPAIPPEVAGGFVQVLDALTGSKVSRGSSSSSGQSPVLLIQQTLNPHQWLKGLLGRRELRQHVSAMCQHVSA